MGGQYSFTKRFLEAMVLVCGVLIITSAVILFIRAGALSEPDDEKLGTAENRAGFIVHYVENDLFGGGAMPQGRHYLKSFTDFVELENSFTANFDREIDLSYTYTATERLVISPSRSASSNGSGNGNGNGSGNGGSPIYEESVTIASASGNGKGQSFSWGGEDSDDGVYTVDLFAYAEIFQNFIEVHEAQMEEQEINGANRPSYNAELIVDFTFRLNAKEYGITKTLTNGFNIPFTTEIYYIARRASGEQSAEFIIPAREFRAPGFWTVSLLVLWFALLLSALFFCLRQLRMDENPLRREVQRVSKKYADEIIFMESPVDMSEHIPIQVMRFEELVKLALSGGKSIYGYQDDTGAHFVVFSDNHAFYRAWLFKPAEPGAPPPDMPPEMQETLSNLME